jgi:hypothetical protein
VNETDFILLGHRRGYDIMDSIYKCDKTQIETVRLSPKTIPANGRGIVVSF